MHHARDAVGGWAETPSLPFSEVTVSGARGLTEERVLQSLRGDNNQKETELNLLRGETNSYDQQQ